MVRYKLTNKVKCSRPFSVLTEINNNVIIKEITYFVKSIFLKSKLFEFIEDFKILSYVLLNLHATYIIHRVTYF